MAKLVLKNGFDPNSTDGGATLLQVCRDSTKTVELLLEYGAEPSGESTLSSICADNVDALLMHAKAGIDMSHPIPEPFTSIPAMPLERAVKIGASNCGYVLKHFLEKGVLERPEIEYADIDELWNRINAAHEFR